MTRRVSLIGVRGGERLRHALTGPMIYGDNELRRVRKAFVSSAGKASRRESDGRDGDGGGDGFESAKVSGVPGVTVRLTQTRTWHRLYVIIIITITIIGMKSHTRCGHGGARAYTHTRTHTQECV